MRGAGVLRGVSRGGVGMILYTADSLANLEKYDPRNWGGDANDYAMKLCLDAVCQF